MELLAIGLKWRYTHEDIIAMKPPPIDDSSLLEKSPYREIYFAVRAILPLNIALVALVVVVLRKPLPEFTYYLEEDSTKPTMDGNGSGSFDNTLGHSNGNMDYDDSEHGVCKADDAASPTSRRKTLNRHSSLDRVKRSR